MNNNNKYIDLTKYEIVTKVGQGSFGKVYKIRNTESQQIYAAKIALESIEEINDHEKKVIYNEIKIISKINHPCFVKFYGYNPYDFNNENKPVIVTEYLPNGSLKKLINDEIEGNAPQEYTYTKKIIILYGIAAGMKYLCSHGILHRDIKPDNILLDNNFYPKICDFGLSKDTINSFSSSSSNFKGTILYMAPEIITDGKYSEKSDVYSFAITIYELFTHKRPFDGQSFFQVLMQIPDGFQPEFPSNINPSIKSLIEKCCDVDPEKRLTFSEITNILKNDTILKELEDKTEFLNYIDNVDHIVAQPNLMHDVSQYEKSEEDESENEEQSENDKNNEKNDYICYFDQIKICPINVYINLSGYHRAKIVKAEIQKNTQAMITIGFHFLHGDCHYPLNKKIAYKYFDLAAKNGDKRGEVYKHKAKLQKNEKIAQKHYDNEQKNTTHHLMKPRRIGKKSLPKDYKWP